MYVGPEGPDVRRENPAVIQGGPALGWPGTNRFDDGIHAVTRDRRTYPFARVAAALADLVDPEDL